MNTHCRQVNISELLMINCAGLSRCTTRITRERSTSARWRASWWSVDNKIVDKLSLWLSVNNVATCIGDGESQILHWANALCTFTSYFYHVSLLTACIVPSFLTRFIAPSPAQKLHGGGTAQARTQPAWHYSSFLHTGNDELWLTSTWTV